MIKKVDARGLSCPQPVILTQNAIKDGEFPIEVLVDTVTARENVYRMALGMKLKVDISGQGDEFELKITK